MTSSPYAHVPAAATTLARRLQPVLNAARARHGLAPAPLLRVDRISTSAGDYGTLSAQARDLHMAANALSFRRFRPAQVRGAHLLVVDDVRVTGAHQRCLMRASEDLPLAARTFLYIAAFPSPAGGCFDPTQEDALNHAAVKTLDDLAEIVEAGDFAWNVRVCKFVLNPANHGELPRFLRRMPGWFVRDLHRNSCRDGYSRMSPYAPSHAVVRAELARRYRRPLAAARPAPVRIARTPGMAYPPDAAPPGAAGGPFAGLVDARHARPVADALVASGAFTVDLRMPRDQWFRWKSGILAPCGCNCRRLNAVPAFRRLVDDALADATRSSFPGADYIVAVAHAGIPWAKTVAERLDLPLAYVRAEARAVGGPLVECSPDDGSQGRHRRGRGGERRQHRAGHPGAARRDQACG